MQGCIFFFKIIPPPQKKKFKIIKFSGKEYISKRILKNHSPPREGGGGSSYKYTPLTTCQQEIHSTAGKDPLNSL